MSLLITNLRKLTRRKGVRMVWGRDDRIRFYFPSGRRRTVWYPNEGRDHDQHIKDLEEVYAGIESGELD